MPRFRSFSKSMVLALAALAVAALSGCVVPQPKGKGQMFIRSEARTGAGYYLYLPEDYIQTEGRRPADKKWPMVVSFHGMRPWDSAGAQIMEWQEEADRYGYVVIAPNTRVSDMLGQLPVSRVSSSVKADERDILAILDEVAQTCDVDPNHVLSTSWSMGGYLAHYMVNRHPERFSCIAVRQSNFSSDILEPQQVPRYRDMKVAVFTTKNDFAICRRESAEAIDWYKQHGFDLTSGIIDRLGHERTPETAAAFYSTTCGAVPRTPPTSLATRITMSSGETARVATRPAPAVAAPVPPPARTADDLDHGTSTTALASNLPARRPQSVAAPVAAPIEPARPSPAGPQPLNTRSRAVPQPVAPRAAVREAPADEAATGPVVVRLSAYIGVSPMLMSYTVQMAPDMMPGVEVLWLDNGQPMSNGISGQKTLSAPGQHKIEAVVMTRGGSEHRASRTVTVLDRLSFED